MINATKIHKYNIINDSLITYPSLKASMPLRTLYDDDGDDDDGYLYKSQTRGVKKSASYISI